MLQLHMTLTLRQWRRQPAAKCVLLSRPNVAASRRVFCVSHHTLTELWKKEKKRNVLLSRLFPVSRYNAGFQLPAESDAATFACLEDDLLSPAEISAILEMLAPIVSSQWTECQDGRSPIDQDHRHWQTKFEIDPILLIIFHYIFISHN